MKVRRASHINQNNPWHLRTNHKTEKDPTQDVKGRYQRKLDVVKKSRVQIREALVPGMKVVKGITGVRIRIAIVRETNDIVTRKKRGTEIRSTEIGIEIKSVIQDAMKKQASLPTKAKGGDFQLKQILH